MNAALIIRGLRIVNPRGEVLMDGIDLDLGAGEIVLLAGPTGSGKSSLFGVLAGLIENGREGWRVSGTVRTGEAEYDLARRAAPLGALVFQDNALFDDLSVTENVAIAADHAAGATAGLPPLAQSLLAGIDGEAAVTSLSGGQAQRLAIARTLPADRPLFLLDEPNSDLDAAAARRLAVLLRHLADATGRPMIIIAHHFGELLDVVDRVAFLDPARAALDMLPAEEDALLGALGGTGAPVPMGDATQDGGDGAGGRGRWLARYVGHYAWQLAFSPSTMVYMALGAVLVGFVSTWFVFQHLPYERVLVPVIRDDVVSGIGFVQVRVLVPLIACMLLASRDGAMIAADLGHRVQARQVLAMRTLGLPVGLYLHGAITVAVFAAALLYVVLLTGLAGFVSMLTWQALFPGAPLEMWREAHVAALLDGGRLLPEGWGWVALKVGASAAAIAATGLFFGLRPKAGVVDVNAGIARTIIAALSAVLVIHTVVALFEFS